MFQSAIHSRLVLLIDHCYPKRGAFSQLEKDSGISRGMWSHVYNGRAKPHGEHLEHLCQKHSNYTLWLMTGQTNEAAGQTSPEIEQLRELEKKVAGK